MCRYNAERLTSGFAKLGGKVTTQTAAGAKTVGDSPDGVYLHPQLRKAASPLDATVARDASNELSSKEKSKPQ